MHRIAVLAAFFLATVVSAAEPAPELWLYYPTNLLVDANVDRLEAIWKRAGQAGYAAVLLADSKFTHLGVLEPRYFANVERVKRIAAAARLRIIPAVFQIGYSSTLLFNDPDLAEALPVKDALFVVEGGVAKPKADPPVALKGGDMADLKRWDWKDEAVVAEDGAAVVRDPAGNARLVQKVRVHPHRQYHLSVRVMTKEFTGKPEAKVLAGDRALSFCDLGVKRTQDWTLHHVVFNSLDHDQVAIYLGVWGGAHGTLAWKDARLEETALVNLVRRPGAPLTITRDGKPVAEGQEVAPIADSRSGHVPWPGEFDVWHEPPAVKAALPDGTELRISYHHAVTVGDGQVMVCPSEPKTVELLRDEMRRVHQAWQADGYFMSHDEIRVLGWDQACTERKLTPGQILADNLKTCAGIAREIAPKATLYVWSDMFDPGHNAHDHYYLVNGDLAGSWLGLDQDVVVALWNFGGRDASLKWFAARGNPLLIAGYYDAPLDDLRAWLVSAKPYAGVRAVMYTTWQNRYDDLEKFAEIVRGK